jgi:hypothetical protein
MRLLIILCLLMMQNLNAQSSISLELVTEIKCEALKGKKMLPFSNRGKDPLHILALQSSHPSITIKALSNPILSGSMGYFLIEYNLTNIPKTQAIALIIKTNDYRKPQLTLLLVDPKQ